jgi:uncharacterized protein (DUF983 family)
MNNLNAILRLKCPKCRNGNLFVRPGLFQYKKILEMPESCSNCGQIYEIEPGFWIGALWTSYPIIVALELPFLLVAVYVRDISIYLILLGMVGVLLFFYPLILRLGRVFWIYIFISKQK